MEDSELIELGKAVLNCEADTIDVYKRQVPLLPDELP